MVRFLILAGLVGVFLAAGFGPARALLDETQYSMNEKVGFAFYRLGGMTPDFDEWVRENPAISELKPTERIERLRTDVYRLESGFYAYHPDEDLIHMQIPALLHRPKKTDPKAETRTLTITIPEMKEVFFPVNVGKIWVSVIPRDIEGLLTLTLSPADYDLAAARAGFVGSGSVKQDVILDLWMRPVSVDTSAPVVINGLELWSLLVDVGSFSLWDEKRSQVVWTYDAPWYVSADRKSVLDLYGQ